MSEVPVDDGSSQPPRDASGRRKVWVTIAVVTVAALVGIGVLYAVSSQPSGIPGPDASSAPTSSSSPSASSPAGNATESPAPAPDDETPPPSAERETLAPAPFDEVVTPAAGVVVAVTSIEAVQGEAIAPGEVSGPALRVTVRVTNEGIEPRALSSAVVNVYVGADALAANPVSRPAGQPFPAELAPGASADGIFVFEAAENQRTRVQIEVDIDLATPIAIFEGSAI